MTLALKDCEGVYYEFCSRVKNNVKNDKSFIFGAGRRPAVSVSAAADTIKLTGIGSNSENGIATVPYFLTSTAAPN